MNAKAVSHLEEISESEIELMSKSETVGVLLPTTAMIMQLPRPPARKMLDSGCIVALGSDFNPNAYCYAMVRIKLFRIRILFEWDIYEIICLF